MRCLRWADGVTVLGRGYCMFYRVGGGARARGRGATVQAAMEHKARDPDRRDPRARCEVHVDRRWESRRGDHEAVGSEILRRVTVSAVARRVGGGGDARRPASDQQATPASEASRGTAARVRAWRGRRRGDRAGTRPRRRRGSTRRTYAADDVTTGPGRYSPEAERYGIRRWIIETVL